MKKSGCVRTTEMDSLGLYRDSFKINATHGNKLSWYWRKHKFESIFMKYNTKSLHQWISWSLPINNNLSACVVLYPLSFNKRVHSYLYGSVFGVGVCSVDILIPFTAAHKVAVPGTWQVTLVFSAQPARYHLIATKALGCILESRIRIS